MRVIVVCNNKGECKGVFEDTDEGNRLAGIVSHYYGAYGHNPACTQTHEVITSFTQLPHDLIKDVESKYDCPCSMYGCCAQPDIFTPEHECIESVCEECFVSECKNCGSFCCCDL